MIHVTMDYDWDPQVLDKVISDNDKWYDAQDQPSPKDWPPHEYFNEYGEFQLRETYHADVTYNDLLDNFPDDKLGPLEDYDVPPPLLPRDDSSLSSSDSDSTIDSFDEYLDNLVYRTHKTKLFNMHHELEQDLDPSDLEELTIEFELQEYKPPHDPADDHTWTWDIWNADVEVHSHILTSFPTTRSQSHRDKAKAQTLDTWEPPTHPIRGWKDFDPGKLTNTVPPTPPKHGEHNAKPPDPAPTPGEPTSNNTHHVETVMEDDDDTDPPVASQIGSAADTARPPGQPTKVKSSPCNFNVLHPLFSFLSAVIIQKTFEKTTQRAQMPNSEVLKTHYQSPHPALNIPR